MLKRYQNNGWRSAFRPKCLSLLTCLMLLMLQMTCVGPKASKTPPITHRDSFREILHGVEISDPYRWLEEQNSPETREWIKSQNAYTHALLDNLPYRKHIYDSLARLMRIDSVESPIERNNRYFFRKKRAEDELRILYVRYGLNGEDKVLIDPHLLSPDHTMDISLEDISWDGTLIVYGVRKGGEDETELRIMDVDTGKHLPDRFPRALYRGVSLKKDKTGFYYNLQNRIVGTRVYYHLMGTKQSEDVEVFGAGYGPDKWISAFVSENGRYLLLSVGYGWGKSEIFVKEIATGGTIKPIVNDIDAHFYSQFAEDRLIMQTDWKAPNNRILAVDLKDPSRDKWKEIVPECNDAIQEYSLVGGRLFVSYLHNVTTRIEIFTIEGKPLGKIPLPGLGTSNSPQGRCDGNEAFISFGSYTQPWTSYHYNTETGKMEIWAQDKVPFDPNLYEVNQVWYSSKDGTRIPMFLVHKKGLKPNGNHPTLLYGYGGFNVSLTPSFSSFAAFWIEHGGVYALANLRGGGEFGEDWHRAGMLDKKQNVFDDFIAAAEWLIKNNYTNPSKLAIMGGSNGGLLMGAALTQRPDLYQAVLCNFPDLDMIGYYRFENNNPPALLEYGNASDPEQFKFLYAYSPYQRVKPGTKYPAVMLMTGDADTRVPPLQARKMTARLQWATASNRPILLLYDTKAGHSGGRPIGKIIEDLSLEMTFLFWQLGIDYPK